MKRMVGIFLAMTVVLSMFAGFTVSAAESASLVLNGSFDEAEQKWGITEANSSAVTIVNEGVNGTKCLKIVALNDGPCATQSVAVEAGKSYMFTAKLKSTAANAVVKLEYKGGVSPKSLYFPARENWETVSSLFIVPEAATGMTMYLRGGRESEGVEGTVLWDDVSVTLEEHPELYTSDQAAANAGWSYKNGAVSYEEDGSMKVAGNKSGSYAVMYHDGGNGTAHAPVLTPGAAYRFSFKFKTNATVNPSPIVRIWHYYGEGKPVNIEYQHTSIGIAYIGKDTAVSSDSITVGFKEQGFEAAETNAWKTYTIYFTVPVLEASYVSSTLWVGQSASYVDAEKTTPADVWLDNLSMRTDYDEIIFLDADGNAVEEIEAGETVTAHVHIAASGLAADKDKSSAVFVGHYGQEGSAKKLLGLGVDKVDLGSILNITVAEKYAAYLEGLTQTFGGKVMVPASDMKYTFTVGVGEAVKIHVWDSFSGMNPIDKVTISATAAEAAE